VDQTLQDFGNFVIAGFWLSLAFT